MGQTDTCSADPDSATGDDDNAEGCYGDDDSMIVVTNETPGGFTFDAEATASSTDQVNPINTSGGKIVGSGKREELPTTRQWDKYGNYVVLKAENDADPDWDYYIWAMQGDAEAKAGYKLKKVKLRSQHANAELIWSDNLGDELVDNGVSITNTSNKSWGLGTVLSPFSSTIGVDMGTSSTFPTYTGRLRRYRATHLYHASWMAFGVTSGGLPAGSTQAVGGAGLWKVRQPAGGAPANFSGGVFGMPITVDKL